MTSILSCRNLWKVYGPHADATLRRALARSDAPGDVAEQLTAGRLVVAACDVSFDVTAGEIFVIMGLSGSGKSTVVRCLSRLIEPSAGAILIEGRDLRQMSERQLIELRRHKLGMVFQHFGLLPWKTVYDNAAFGLAMAHAPAERINERVGHYLDLVGLAGFERHYPYQLSGGMQQRVGLVRALAVNPSILLMDEPCAALDAQTREILQDELLALMNRADERKTMVFITHSIDEAILLGDRIAVMSARPGRIKEILDVPLARPRDGNALRADPHFAQLRAHIWNELRAPQSAEAA